MKLIGSKEKDFGNWMGKIFGGGMRIEKDIERIEGI